MGCSIAGATPSCALDERGIESRPVFGRALSLQLGYRRPHHRVMSTEVAERVQREGFLIPCHPAMTDEQVAYTAAEVAEQLAR